MGESDLVNSHYDAHGVEFDYPEGWELEVADGDDGVTITVSNGETSFWSLRLMFDRVPVEEVMDTALATFREEYGDLDEYPISEELCNHPAAGVDIEFVCMELINSAALRAFRTDRFTAFVLYQATDVELPNTRRVLEAISVSLEYDFGDEMIIG